MDDEQEAFDAACWAQQEQDERRQREDEALLRHRGHMAELRKIMREHEADEAAFRKFISNSTHTGT